MLARHTMANCENPGTGADFEKVVRTAFANQGILLQRGFPVPVGFGGSRKIRRFDLGSEDPAVLVECKCHTWTAGNNAPSAKLTSWNEAMLYFGVAPRQYRKMLAVQRSLRGDLSLANHYLSRFEHLVPTDVEVWEIDTNSGVGRCLHPPATQRFRWSSRLLHAFDVPSELVTEFFVTFARFEYALKQAGYVQGDQARVAPDWDRFGREVARLDAQELALVLDRCVYLRQNPPRKQVLVNGVVTWDLPNRAQSEIENALLNVRTVRNNVFHGGKFDVGPVPEPLRDRQLLEDCVAVLNALLELPHLPTGVAAKFADLTAVVEPPYRVLADSPSY